MKPEMKKILLINLGIFAVYTLLSYLISPKEGMIYHAFFIVSHVILNFLIGIISLIANSRNSNGGAYILSAALVLVIGFGTCMGITQLIGAKLNI
jgi:peptidoglycan/LPS O-acetylase OafA/YrhL